MILMMKFEVENINSKDTGSCYIATYVHEKDKKKAKDFFKLNFNNESNNILKREKRELKGTKYNKNIIKSKNMIKNHHYHYLLP